MKVLVIDIGGTHVKALVSGARVPRKAESGPTMTPAAMVSAVKKLAAGWRYDVVSMGYPGPVLNGRPVSDPKNLTRLDRLRQIAQQLAHPEGLTDAQARQLAMYLTKQLTPLTLVEIGRRFGNRDHSTVLYACARVAERVATDPAFAEMVDRIRRALTEPPESKPAGQQVSP